MNTTPRQEVAFDETVLSLIRNDGSLHFETNDCMCLNGKFTDEMADWGKLPRGWDWTIRTAHRVGYIGHLGGFCETSRTYTEANIKLA